MGGVVVGMRSEVDNEVWCGGHDPWREVCAKRHER